MSESRDLSLRRVGSSDARMLFDWANDPEVRSNSFCTDAIKWEDHLRWFERKLRDPSSHIFIAVLSGVPVGQIRLDVIGEDAEIGYSIAREHRGRGLSTKMVALAEVEARSFARRLVAHVKSDNVRSIAVFERRDFLREVAGDHLRFVKKI